jgi:hypothetical protein
LIVFAYVLYRQVLPRPVTRLDFLLPGLGALYLAIRYLPDSAASPAIVVMVMTATGIASGLIVGEIVRVERDDRTSLIYQAGGLRYGAFVVGLLAIRLAMHLIAQGLGSSASFAQLNDAFIALLLGNYLGRNVNVVVRALVLVGWRYREIPPSRDARRIAASRRKRPS